MGCPNSASSAWLPLSNFPSIAASAVGSMVANAAVAVFALTYAALAQKRSLVVSLGVAFLAWLSCAALSRLVHWTAAEAIVLNAIVYPVAIAAGSRAVLEDAGLWDALPLPTGPIRQRPSQVPFPAQRASTLLKRNTLKPGKPSCGKTGRATWLPNWKPRKNSPFAALKKTA